MTNMLSQFQAKLQSGFNPTEKGPALSRPQDGSQGIGHVAAFKSIPITQGNFTNLFSSTAQVSIIIPNNALPAQFKNPLLEIEISVAGSSVVLSDVFNWFSKMLLRCNSKELGNAYPVPSYFANILLTKKSQMRSMFKSYGLDYKTDNFLNASKSLPAGTVQKFYLPLGLWLPYQNFNWQENFAQGSLELFVSPQPIIVSGSGTITVTSVNLRVETPMSLNTALITANSRLRPSSARFLDHQSVIQNTPTTLTSGILNSIPIPTLEGNVAMLLVAIRAINNSNTNYSNMKFYNVGHEHGAALDLVNGTTSFLANGSTIPTDHFQNLYAGHWFENDVLSQKNIMVIPLCEDVNRTLQGVHTGSYPFHSQNGYRINLTLPAAPVSEIQTITTTATPGAGYYRFRFRNVISEPLAWNATAATMKTTFENISSVASRNITVTFSAALGTGVTATFVHPETDGLENDKFEIVDSSVAVTVTLVPISCTTAITTSGTSGLATGSYAVDVWALRYKAIVQSTKGQIELIDA